MPNTENINKVIARLKADEAVGTHFIMCDFVAYVDVDKVPHEQFGQYHVCNTAFCLAGWANLIRISEDKPAFLSGSTFMCAMGNSRAAGEWLGMDDDDHDFDDLFMMHGAGIGMATFDLLPAAQRYAAGIRVLEILRDENVIDWSRALTEAGINHEDYEL